MPKHVAIDIQGANVYAVQEKCSVAVAYKIQFEHIRKLIGAMVDKGIPLMSFNVLPAQYEDKDLSILLDFITVFFTELRQWPFLAERQVKISVLGKWYELPSRVLTPIKQVIESTKEYDAFFVNFFVNYDGREELVDACQLIGKLVRLDKLDPQHITTATIKENLYTSYFLPPDLIIKQGNSRKIGDFLLWDSPNAKMLFSNKLAPEFDVHQLEKALQWWSH